jgi:regulator of sigma E protease
VTPVVQSIITIVIFFAMLGALVVIHELGHFVTARLAGVRVLEFGIGFPPRARVLRSKGETLYTLNWLPVGGFVRLEGEDGDSDDARSFVRARLPIKLVILVSGVAMNVVLAFLIFLAISALANPTWNLTVSEVKPASPAATAGLVAGDQVQTLDGQAFDGFKDPSLALRAKAGQTVVLGVQRADGSHQMISAALRRAEDVTPTNGALGIAFGSTIVYAQNPPDAAIGLAASRTGEALTIIWDGLRKLADSIVNRPTEAPPVTGPIGIASQVGDVFWKLGPVFTLYFAGILSANLAVVNILPFPPLDGGRVAILLYKSATDLVRRIFGLPARDERVSLRVERLTYVIGFACLMAFLVWISFFDITAPGRGQ